MEIRKCVICGREFESRRGAKTCSPECSKANNRRTKREWRRKHPPEGFEPRTCLVCGSVFAPYNVEQKLCSEQCRRAFVMQMAAKKPKTRRVCAVCGKEFETSSSQRLCCSQECSATYREKNKKKRGANRAEAAERNAQLAAEGSDVRWCTQCGVQFSVNDDGSTPNRCARCAERMRNHARAKSEREQMNAPKPSRRCHDCGKPTWDYRCQKCQAKWREKNHVRQDPDGCVEDLHVWI